MKLSKRLREWKANLTTQTPAEYVLTLRADVNGFADEVKVLEDENSSLRMERDFYYQQVEENAKKTQAAYESLSDENDKLEQKRIALLHKVDQLNDVIRRQRKQLTDVQEAMRKRNADNKRLKQVSEKLFRAVNHFCVKGYPCISCPLCREEAPCELVKSYFALKELGCDVRAWR